MEIKKDTVVSLTYKLSNEEGAVLEQSEKAITYLHGGYDGIFPAVEEALHGKKEGDSIDITLEADEAFGEYDEDLVRHEPRGSFPEGNINSGMQFEGGSEGSDDTIIYTVTSVTDDEVVVDGNHPLAGQNLRFACTVMGVRPATPEELQHGHVHGEHGHHH